MAPHPVAAREKALKVKLDPRFYGTFAEIGAGQEPTTATSISRIS